MSIMKMNMSQGNIERDEPLNTEYDDEIMCSGWNPALAMIQLVAEDKHSAFPSELATVDVEVLLKKMYG